MTFIEVHLYMLVIHKIVTNSYIVSFVLSWIWIEDLCSAKKLYEVLVSQIGSTVVKVFAFQADGLGFISPSGYKVGCPGHSKYVWVGQYEPSCIVLPSSVVEDKLQ